MTMNRVAHGQRTRFRFSRSNVNSRQLCESRAKSRFARRAATFERMAKRSFIRTPLPGFGAGFDSEFRAKISAAVDWLPEEFEPKREDALRCCGQGDRLAQGIKPALFVFFGTRDVGVGLRQGRDPSKRSVGDAADVAESFRDELILQGEPIRTSPPPLALERFFSIRELTGWD